MDEPKQRSLILASSNPTPKTRRTAIRPTVAERLYQEQVAMAAEDAKKAGALGYFARSLVQATLPYKEPDPNLPVWFRQAEDVALMIKPGYYIDRSGDKPESKSIGYPYGSIPRLLIAWISTAVKLQQQRELVLGKQLSEFMTAIGLDKHTGGKTGSITRLRDQMKRLFAADMAIVRGGSPEDASFSNSKYSVADSTNLWWDPQSPEQAGLWESTVVLSEKLYKELIENPIPIDLRALAALSAAPMAIDLYSYLTWRMFNLKKATTIPWEALWVQFGSNSDSENAQKKFKQLFKATLERVLLVYPEAKATPVKSGLYIAPSQTSIPRAKNDD